MAFKTLKVARGLIGGRDAFRVLSARNYTRLAPGAVISKAEVDDLVQYGGVDVSIVELVDDERFLSAVEFGVRCAEKGMNVQAARSEWTRLGQSSKRRSE